MKIGVSSYSFQQLIDSGEETQLSIMKKAAEMGFDGIEFTDLIPPADVSESSYAEMIRSESERLSLPVISYTISAATKGLTQRSSVFAARLTWRRYSALSA